MKAAVGETPINNSIAFYEELRKRHPEFVEEIEQKVGTILNSQARSTVSMLIWIFQGVLYQLFYPNTPRDDTTSPGTSILQSYGKYVLESDTVEQARTKIEKEIGRLPTATWVWENQSEQNPLGDLRVWQRLPGTFTSFSQVDYWSIP